MRKITALLCVLCLLSFAAGAKNSDCVWSLGTLNHNGNEFALSPDGYAKFVEGDFGYEDKYFLIGHSDVRNDFPYVLPGPADTWGGTWPTSGWRTHEVNILFSSDKEPDSKADYVLNVDLADYSKQFLPLVKISVNGKSVKIQLKDKNGKFVFKKPGLMEKCLDTLSLKGDCSLATPKNLKVSLKGSDLRQGGNEVSITVLEGSWIMFDQISLVGKSLKLSKAEDFYVRNVEAASYQLNGTQPLIVDVEHLRNSPELSVKVDGKIIFKQIVEQGRYQFEALMEGVSTIIKSKYEVLCDGESVASGIVIRSPQKEQTLADYVDTRLGTAHSRWMIAPGPWMPFSMVKVSPDNQNVGWQAGYQPSFESVGCFSHVHEWTLGGFGIMASNGPLETRVGDEQRPDEGYRSRIDKSTEAAGIGEYSVVLEDYGIKAEVSATTRCSFFKFTFPQDRDDARILVELHPNTEYGIDIQNVKVSKVSPTRIEGLCHQLSRQVWSDDAEQDYTLHFVMEFDHPMESMGSSNNDDVENDIQSLLTGECKAAGVFANFDPHKTPVVKVRVGISPVSIANASENLSTEIGLPFGWSLEKVVDNQKAVWNDLFGRIRISTDDRIEKTKFYNYMYRSLCSRNIWSDGNGQWISTDGKLRQVADPSQDVMIGSDAFWNTFWNLNQFWNLVTPEWSSKWAHSQLAMYDANGFLAKGPAGLNYIPVMVGEHEIPQIVSAWQMGIRDFDANKALEAAVKMQTTPAQKVYKGFAGNRDIVSYMKYRYVPYDKGRFSNVMEYSYDDWTVSQLALALGEDEIYKTFLDRGYWWKNVISDDGYCQMKDSKGNWMTPFDPFRSGANQHYVEGNSWQLTFFVPQDIPALVEKIGKDRFLERLSWGFNQDEGWRYNAPNDQYWDHPVVQGNQQSMHFAYLFNYAGAPWLTQKWSRSVLDRYYGYGMANAFLGDEDQGQMSAWAIMTAIGLFQMDGGTAVNPVYEISSPAFRRIEINLGGRYGRGDKFTIVAKNASKKNVYVQSAELNGKSLDSFLIPASSVLSGGTLELVMGPEPNKNWGIADSELFF